MVNRLLRDGLRGWICSIYVAMRRSKYTCTPSRLLSSIYYIPDPYSYVRKVPTV